MRFKVQLIVEADDQRPIVTELARVERSVLDAGNLGLQLSEARKLLGQLQVTMVDAQIDAFITEASECTECRRPLGRKGEHEIAYRTVFGKLRLNSPRLYRCPKCHAGRESFSPLAMCLPERTSPELQYLQTKFAALMSFGLTVDVLSEVLPLETSLSPTSVRRWTQRIGERLEQARQKSANEALTPTRYSYP